MVAAVEDALAVRAAPEVVRAAVATIIAGYRTPDFQDPATFARMAVEAIEDYPAVTILRLASPKTGILRSAKWPPTIAELVAWCEQDLVPVRSAVEMACRQIERCRWAEKSAQRAIEAAAMQAKAKAEWEAGAEERAKTALAAEKIAKEAAAKARMDDAARRRSVAARGALEQRLFAWAREQGAGVVDRAMGLDEAEMEEGVRRELWKADTGFAYLVERLGAEA